MTVPLLTIPIDSPTPTQERNREQHAAVPAPDRLRIEYTTHAANGLDMKTVLAAIKSLEKKIL